MNQFKWVKKSFEELSANEVYAIGHLRQEVFVVEQDCPYLDFDNVDQKCWHIMVWNERNDLVAYTRLVPVGVSYANDISIGRVVTSSKARGEGLGILLMKESIKYSWEIFGENTIRISAQDYLLKFYTNLGFVETGKKYLEDNIPHSEMYLEFSKNKN